MHGLIERIPRTPRNRVSDAGIGTALCYESTHTRVLRPALTRDTDGSWLVGAVENHFDRALQQGSHSAPAAHVAQLDDHGMVEGHLNGRYLEVRGPDHPEYRSYSFTRYQSRCGSSGP